MAFQLETSARGARATVSTRMLTHWARRVFRAVRPGADAVISVAFVSSARSRTLNRQYRGKDHVADVLSFDLGRMPGNSAQHIQIVLCPSALRQRARKEGDAVRATTIRLFVHGLLHALGHRHERERDFQRMHRVEQRLVHASTL